MANTIEYSEDTKLILVNSEYGFKPLIDDFEKSEYINVITFNVSPKKNILLNELKKAQGLKKITLITNIPGRWDDYTSDFAEEKAKYTIKNYFKQLNPETFSSPIEIYFNFKNHSKIYTTSNYAYIGSQNYSDESIKSWEAGVIINDKEKVKEINKKFIEKIKESSIRYYGSQIEVFKEQFEENFESIQKILIDLRNLKDAYISLDQHFKIKKGQFNEIEKELNSILDKIYVSEIDCELLTDLEDSTLNSKLEMEELISILEYEMEELNSFDHNEHVIELLDSEFSDAFEENLEKRIEEASGMSVDKFYELYDNYLEKFDENLKEKSLEFLPIRKLIMNLTGNEDIIDNTN